MKKLFLVLGFLFLTAQVCIAQPTIEASVEKTKISTDETLIYQLTIAFSSINIPQPKFPEFKDFYVISEAESSTISFQKAGAKTILVYAFILAPKNTGKFSIEPAQIKAEGKTYTSKGFEIEVTQGKAKPKAVPEDSPAKSENNLPETQEPKITL